MDSRKDQSRLKLHETLNPDPQKTHAPETKGTWSLRNREQLRKRKAEVGEKQTSQCLAREQRKRKYQRTGRGNYRGQKRPCNLEANLAPPSQTEQEAMEKELMSAEKEVGHPVTEALPVLASPPEAVPAECCSGIHQCQENSSKYQEIAVQNHSSQTHQHMGKSEDLSPNMCQETAEPLEHSKVHQDMGESEILYPNMFWETAVPPEHSKVDQDISELPPNMCQETQEHSSKVDQDMAELPPNMHQETQEHSSKVDQDISELPPNMRQETQEHSSKVDQDMAEVSPNMHQETQEHSSKVDHDMAEFSPNLYQETGMPQDHSSKAHQNMAGPEILFPKMCQETAAAHEHPLELCQDVADPEILSPKTRQGQGMAVPKPPSCSTPGDIAGPKGCFPEVSPRSDVPENPKPTGPEGFTSKPEQGIAITEDFLPQTQISLSEDVNTKTQKEAVQPEYFSHETYKEITAPSQKAIQETPGPEEYSLETCQQTAKPEKYAPEPHQETSGPEEYSPEMYQEALGPENQSPETYQEMPEPEDLSVKNCKHKDGPKNCLPELAQEAGVLQGQDPDTFQEDDKDTCAFSQASDDIEMKTPELIKILK